MVLSPDSGLVVTGDGDGVLRIWDAASGRPRIALPGHTAPMYTAAFNLDGAVLAVGDAAALRLYDAASGTLIRELGGHHGPVYRAAFSAVGDMLATGDREGWSGSGIQRRLLHELAGHTCSVYTLAFHPRGDRLASGDTDGQVRLWDLPAGRDAGLLSGHRGAVYWVTFSHG